MHEIKTEDFYEDLSSDKEMSDFNNYLTKSKCYDDSNKLVIGKMKDKTGGVVIEEFVGMKPKMYSFLVDNNEYRKAKDVNKNLVATISHSKYKYVLLNKNVWDIQWIEFKVKIIKQELMKSTRILCLALMIKYVSKTMDKMD